MSLRDELAQVLKQHVPYVNNSGVRRGCSCGSWPADMVTHHADVIINNFGLTEELAVTNQRRYVTPWEAV